MEENKEKEIEKKDKISNSEKEVAQETSDNLKKDNEKEEISKEPLPTAPVSEDKSSLADQSEKKEKEEKPKTPKTEMEKFRTITPVRPKRERIEVKKEFEEKILEIKRVARVVRGGRRFKFRAAVVVGNSEGRLGIGIGKGAEVTSAVTKAVAKAKKNMVEIERADSTIPFDIKSSFKSAKVLLKPAKKGTGIIAGGPVRAVVELAGISDISSKMLGSSNKISNMIATFQALKNLSRFKRKK